ncbi:type II toxin-antitoxin system RelE/ParE family toxin [Cyanobium sp. WAJ14-Wanaka]|uniref:type II toxin-antitoxin system RelE/ParE family toxin n=1 Tax=Cyanobium sp. WAJ14-Wanaka TaxID=2823725 RepID=UPI0020CFB4D4|nr:type II toxin-antitoxin system RelE/ParE family toxin [Cyanobium sp. WAJ14-Wanaka]MCP9775929.1 type II toxin-antitoxin system RelE/ParE family toxin [Cyanobium sp. WAJ14-Wanaka]
MRLRVAARDDLEAAARWYEAQELGLGRLFLAEVRLLFQRIRTNPEAYPSSYRGTRRALLRRFPYGVIYLPVPEQGSFVVLAVLHCGRDP